MNIQSTTICILLLFLSFNVFGQGLKLYSGKKEITVLPEQKMSINLGDFTRDSFWHTSHLGYILDESKDSLKIKFEKLRTVYRDLEGMQINTMSLNNCAETWIPKDDIWSMNSYLEPKLRKRNKKLSVVSGMLFCGGLGTLISTVIVKDKTDVRNLLIAAGGQIVAGTIIISLNKRSKTYLFKEYKGKRRWHFEDKSVVSQK